MNCILFNANQLPFFDNRKPNQSRVRSNWAVFTLPPGLPLTSCAALIVCGSLTSSSKMSIYWRC